MRAARQGAALSFFLACSSYFGGAGEDTGVPNAKTAEVLLSKAPCSSPAALHVPVNEIFAFPQDSRVKVTLMLVVSLDIVRVVASMTDTHS